MFFLVKNNKYLSLEQLRTDTLLNAYFVVKNFPMGASDMLLEQYIQQQYGASLKDVCTKLLLSLTYYKDDEGNLILMFKDPKLNKLAQLITYGNGTIPGSKILQIALKS